MTDTDVPPSITLQFKAPIPPEELADILWRVQSLMLNDPEFWKQYPADIVTHLPAPETDQ